MESFGKWIKNRRHEKRISLWRCAGYAGIGGEALRLIECGKTNPANCKVSTLYGLAEVLEIDPAALIDLAVHQDAELVKRLRYGMERKDREREDSEASYHIYLARANRGNIPSPQG